MTSRVDMTVDAYVATQEPERRRRLSTLRAQIERVLPRVLVQRERDGRACMIERRCFQTKVSQVGVGRDDAE